MNAFYQAMRRVNELQVEVSRADGSCPLRIENTSLASELETAVAELR